MAASSISFAHMTSPELKSAADKMFHSRWNELDEDALNAFGENGYSPDRDTRRERLDALADPQFDVLERKFFEFSDADSDQALGWLARQYGKVGLIDA